MSFFSGWQFFVAAGLTCIIALVVGIMQRKLKWINFISSIVIGIVILGSSLQQLLYFTGYILFEIILVETYIVLRKKYDRKAWIYRLYVFLAILPLILCKLCDLQVFHEMGWFQFTGISYLTFRVVQIIIEVYDGVIKEQGLFDLISFLIFFPTFSCGPIDRSRRYEEDLNKEYSKAEYLELFGEGLFKFFLGLVYKFVLADIMYQLMTRVTMYIPENTFNHMALYAYTYGLYMFFDFAGYSLMAIGVGYALGIKVPDNFNKPFVSKDMKEFWNRWHISLSTWFRDFVFSRFIMTAMKKKWFKERLTGASIGLIINMLIMGLWHGLSVHYILYGLYHGVILAITEVFQKKSKFYKKNKKKNWYKAVSWFITINLVMFGFLIFSGHLITV